MLLTCAIVAELLCVGIIAGPHVAIFLFVASMVGVVGCGALLRE